MIERTESDYIFADAFIGCSVAKLLNKNDLTRLANCGDLNTAETLLQDFGYLECKEIAAGDIDTFIQREQNNLYELIFQNVAGREELACYLFPFDYHNIKVCIKAELLGITPDEKLLISTSEIESKRLITMIRDRKLDSLRPTMREAILEAFDTYGRGGDPQEIDLILDRACYRDMAKHAEETECQFIRDMVAAQADTINLKNFARLKNMERPYSFFQKVFLDAGSIREEVFQNSYDEPLIQMADKLVDPNFAEAIRNGAKDLEELGNFMHLEKYLNDAAMEVNKKGKFVTFGLEPIAAFWYAREMEIDNIRIILNGIMAGLQPEVIEDILYEPYVS